MTKHNSIKFTKQISNEFSREQNVSTWKYRKCNMLSNNTKSIIRMKWLRKLCCLYVQELQRKQRSIPDYLYVRGTPDNVFYDYFDDDYNYINQEDVDNSSQNEMLEKLHHGGIKHEEDKHILAGQKPINKNNISDKQDIQEISTVVQTSLVSIEFIIKSWMLIIMHYYSLRPIIFIFNWNFAESKVESIFGTICSNWRTWFWIHIFPSRSSPPKNSNWT